MMQQRGSWRAAVASRAAVGVLLLALSGVIGLASGAGVVPGPVVQEGLFVRSKWIFKREFFFKRDQIRSGMVNVAMKDNRLAEFATSGEVGYWKVERRSVPGAKRKLSMRGGMDVLVLDVPDQGDNKDLIVSYEIPVAEGRYHANAIKFANEGSIFVAGSKEELVGAAGAARKKIGTFSVDLKTLPPMIDRTFTA